MEDLLIIEDKIKKINDLSFKSKNTNNVDEKEKIDNEVKNILINLKKDAISSFQSETDIKRFLSSATP